MSDTSTQHESYPDDPGDLPMIHIPGDGRTYSETIDELIPPVLDKLEWYSFQGGLTRPRNGELVRIDINEALSEIEAAVRFFHIKKNKEDEWVDTVCPISRNSLSALIYSTRFLDSLPKVERVAHAPLVFNDNGKMGLTPTGYHAETNTYTFWDREMPQPADLGESLAIIREVLGEFCFAPQLEFGGYGSNLQNALAYLMTPFLRLLFVGLPAAAAIRGNRPGLGKSQLVSAFTVLATGKPAAAAVYTDEKEFKKFLFSAALGGSSIVWIDEVPPKFSSPSLASVISSGMVSDRIFHAQRIVAASLEACIFISGNNYRVPEDLERRLLLICLHLDEDESIDSRNFTHPDQLGWLLNNRDKVLSAIYGLAGEWFRLGRPRSDVQFTTFTDWAQVVGGVIQSAGGTEFMKHRLNVNKVLNGASEDLEKLISLWGEAQIMSPASTKLRHALAICKANDLFTDRIKRGDDSARKRLGKVLTGLSGDTIGDWKLEKETTSPATYKITKMNGAK